MKKQTFQLTELPYELWSFQKKVLSEIGDTTLILGLPTGLGKTYIAGAKIQEESLKRPLRVLFLVPSVPLGVQQTLFAREKLGVSALFISGGVSPQRREKLKVWNNAFVIATPETFYNDNLAKYSKVLKEARSFENPFDYLSYFIKDFPFDMLVADECQRYIGQTDGYSILLAAAAAGVKILALSATPQLHAAHRLKELRKVFKQVKVFSLDEPGVKEHMPRRLLIVEEVETPPKLAVVYRALGDLSRGLQFRIRKMYGPSHTRGCTVHPPCRALMAIDRSSHDLEILSIPRLVETSKPTRFMYETGFSSALEQLSQIHSHPEPIPVSAMTLIGSIEKLGGRLSRVTQ